MSDKKSPFSIKLSEPFISGNESNYINDCLKSSWISSSGKYLDKLEAGIAKYIKAKYAVACINGTSGLQVALRLAGVEMNNEVIVPTVTFIASANSVRHLNAEPVFMDCDECLNIDPEKLEEFCRKECKKTKYGLRNKQSGRIIKAIMPVHVFGNPCDIWEVKRIAKKYRLKIIEDACESLGSFYLKGRKGLIHTGTVGEAGIFSFNGNKIITAGGGGMIITDNKKLAEKARYLITQAKNDSIRYIHNEVGYNFRMSNLQAAIGLAQLEKLKDFIKRKKRNYSLYKKELKDVEGLSLIGAPKGTKPNYWFHSLLVEEKKYGMSRNNLLKKLISKRIEVRPLWYLNHKQKPFRNNQAYKIERALWFYERVLNIPCSSGLKEEEVRKVVSVLKKTKR